MENDKTVRIDPTLLSDLKDRINQKRMVDALFQRTVEQGIDDAPPNTMANVIEAKQGADTAYFDAFDFETVAALLELVKL